jgi:hypothetical protein
MPQVSARDYKSRIYDDMCGYISRDYKSRPYDGIVHISYGFIIPSNPNYGSLWTQFLYAKERLEKIDTSAQFLSLKHSLMPLMLTFCKHNISVDFHKGKMDAQATQFYLITYPSIYS